MTDMTDNHSPAGLLHTHDHKQSDPGHEKEDGDGQSCGKYLNIRAFAIALSTRIISVKFRIGIGHISQLLQGFLLSRTSKVTTVS